MPNRLSMASTPPGNVASNDLIRAESSACQASVLLDFGHLILFVLSGFLVSAHGSGSCEVVGIGSWCSQRASSLSAMLCPSALWCLTWLLVPLGPFLATLHLPLVDPLKVVTFSHRHGHFRRILSSFAGVLVFSFQSRHYCVIRPIRSIFHPASRMARKHNLP